MGEAEGGVVCECSCRTAGDLECLWTLQVENAAASWETEMDAGDDAAAAAAGRVEASVCVKARRAVEWPRRSIVAMALRMDLLCLVPLWSSQVPSEMRVVSKFNSR